MRHPEMEGKETEIAETLKNADFVQRSAYSSDALLYYRGIQIKRYFVVVVALFKYF